MILNAAYTCFGFGTEAHRLDVDASFSAAELATLAMRSMPLFSSMISPRASFSACCRSFAVRPPLRTCPEEVSETGCQPEHDYRHECSCYGQQSR